MAHCDFSPEFKSECIRDIILLLRSDPGRDEVLEIVEHAACFLGCGAKMLRGSGPVVGASQGGKDYNQQADLLAAALPEQGEEPVLQGVPWMTIVKILLPIIIDLLTEESDA